MFRSNLQRSAAVVVAGLVIAGHSASAAILVTNGSDILKYTDAGVADGTFASGITGGATDVDIHGGAVYVTTYSPAGVYKFDFNGNALGQLTSGTPSRTLKSDFGPDGNLYVGGVDTSTVYKYNGTTGAFISNFATGAFNNLSELRWGPDGNLYTSGQSNGFVRRYNGSTGALMYSWDTTVGSDRTGGVKGMDFSPDGTRLYITDSNYGLRYINLATNAVTTLISIAAGWTGNDVKFGPDGFLYSLNRYGTKDIRKYDPDTGAYLGQLVTDLPGDQWGMAFGSIPEPSSLAILALGGLTLLRRRRRA